MSLTQLLCTNLFLFPNVLYLKNSRGANHFVKKYRASAKIHLHYRLVCVYDHKVKVKYMGTFTLGPSTVKMKVICPIVATE